MPEFGMIGPGSGVRWPALTFFATAPNSHSGSPAEEHDLHRTELRRYLSAKANGVAEQVETDRLDATHLDPGEVNLCAERRCKPGNLLGVVPGKRAQPEHSWVVPQLVEVALGNRRRCPAPYVD